MKWLCLAAILCASACNRRGMDTPEAVRQGVVDYLSNRSNLNISAMNVNVSSVSFRRDEADAIVSFTAKGDTSGKGIEMRYTLTRSGSRWVVKDKSESAGAPHGQPGR